MCTFWYENLAHAQSSAEIFFSGMKKAIGDGLFAGVKKLY